MSKNSPNIYVVGSFVMGVTIQVPRMPVTGETISGKNFNMGAGGKGVNQAIAATRAGANVQVSVCVGNDLFGEIALDILEKECLISDSVHVISDSITGCGLVTLLESGDNSIIIDPGANLNLTSEMITKDEEAIRKSKVVLAQLEVSNEPVETALKLGRKYDSITILNPAPARKLPFSILDFVDIITPNETEAKLLLDLPLDSTLSSEELGKMLLGLGVKSVVITCGEQGAVLTDRTGSIRITAPKISPIDTTGAGDCFNGNLAIGLGRGLSIIEAVKRAVFAGAYCAQRLGVIDGLPYENELDTYITKLTSL